MNDGGINQRGINQRDMGAGETGAGGMGDAPADGSADGRARERAWRDMLDLFESDAADPDAGSDAAEPGYLAEAGPVEPWLPPHDLGPLPASLADRAHAVLAAQAARAASVRADLTTVRSHLDALARIPADGAETAVYLDRNG